MADRDSSNKRFVPVALGIVLIASVCALLFLPESSTPFVRWKVDGHDETPAIVDSQPETPFSFAVHLPRAAHVYVFTSDPIRGALACFPSAWLKSDLPANPLPAGRHVLPGRHTDVDLAWHTGHVGGPVSVIVVASDKPLDDVRDKFARWRQMGNAAFPGRRVLGTYAPKGGMGGVPARVELPAGVLRDAARTVDETGDGPMVPLAGHAGVWVKVLHFDNAQPDPESVRDQVQKALNGLPGAPTGRLPGTRPGPQPPKPPGKKRP